MGITRKAFRRCASQVSLLDVNVDVYVGHHVHLYVGHHVISYEDIIRKQRVGPEEKVGSLIICHALLKAAKEDAMQGGEVTPSYCSQLSEAPPSKQRSKTVTEAPAGDRDGLARKITRHCQLFFLR